MAKFDGNTDYNRYERRDAAPGAVVQTMDGSRLGKVSETRGESFKVHTGLFRRDYWLESALISAADENAVIVNVLDRDIDQYKLMDAIETNDALLRGSEMDEQRRRMEEELKARKQ